MQGARVVIALSFVLAWMGISAKVSAAQDISRSYDPLNQFGVFAEYSNDSSHILIGVSEARKLLIAGGSYSRRVKESKTAAWRWQFDVKPLVELRNPVVTSTVVNTYQPSTTPVEGYPPGGFYNMYLSKQDCRTYSAIFPIDQDKQGVITTIGTSSVQQVCAHPWTYGGAISPLGQKINFLPRRRLQPIVAGNAGFVAFSKVTPSNNATMFNFSFEVGAGFDYYLSPNRAISVDFRFHHISNAYRGQENPGVDSGLLRVNYLFGR